GHPRLADHDVVGAAGDLLEDTVVVVQAVPGLIDISRHHALANYQFASVRLLLAYDHSEQGRLAGAIGADHADDAAARQVEVQILHEQDVAVALADALGADDGAAQGRAGRDLQDQFLLALVVLLVGELLVGAEAGLV